jgi:glycosyltransferase involved in cell wall biosynthesis
VDLVREGQQRGHRTTVLCIERPGALAAVVESLGGQVRCLDKPRGRSVKALSDARDLLCELEPDVVHTHQVGALWYLGQAAGSASVPVVHTEHSDHIAHSRGLIAKLKVRWMWRQTAPLAARFCCVSEDIARSVRRYGTVPRAKVDVVQNGIDPAVYADSGAGHEVRRACGIPRGALVVGTVGRLAEVKRQDLLIRAFAGLCALGKHANTWLLIVGDGPERPQLARLVASLGIQDRTVFAGYQAQPQRFYQAMDLFALTSRHEGLPLSLLEAWASGLPVVASAVGAIPQTVAHGVTGMLFESGDQAALTETLEGLLDSPAWMSQLARRGRRQVEAKYSLGRMADQYEDHYRTLVGSTKGRVEAQRT